MMVTAKDVWAHARNDHRAFVTSQLEAAAQNPGVSSPTLKWLLGTSRRRDDLAVGTPEILRALMKQVSHQLYLTSAQARKVFHTEARAVFDYERFSQKTTQPWNAMRLCKRAQLMLCPYCHQAYAFTVQSTSTPKAFRPTLDHFYCKAKYPYLALSLFNLVPACYSCNSSLKGAHDCLQKPLLHPLEDDEAVRFEIDPESYLAWQATPDGELRLNVTSRHADAAVRQRATESIETFLLAERFEANLEHLSRFARSVELWSPEEINRWRKESSITASEAVLLNFDRQQYRHELLGAIKRDLYDELQSRRS